MEKLADETTIHGVKEAFYANKIGRLFWVLIFVSCATITIFQVKGLFNSNVEQAVGTRVSPVELFGLHPSFYYCSPFWLPHEEAFSQLDGCDLSNAKTEEFIDCYFNYISNISAEAQLNSILIPTGSPINTAYREYFESSFGEIGNFSEKLYFKEITEKYKASISQFVITATFDGNDTHGRFTHGLTTDLENLIPEVKNYVSVLHLVDSFAKLYSAKKDSVSLNLDGVCFKIKPRIQRLEETTGRKYLHTVVHYGAYGKGLRSHIKKIGFDTPPGHINFLETVLPSYPLMVENWLATNGTNEGFRFPFATFGAIANQEEKHLYFKKKFKLTTQNLRVNIKFWSTRIKHLSRTNNPCRENWTILDQAHCNQIQYLAKSSHHACEHYLPASQHYAETRVNNNTCIRNFPGLAFSKLNSDEGLIRNLTSTSNGCQRPCSENSFGFTTTNVVPTLSDEVSCLGALENVLMDRNKTISYQSSSKKNGTLDSDLEQTQIMFYTNLQKLRTLWNASSSFMPCTVVEYDQTETHGLLFEDYLRFGVKDLVSDLGGTIGLWTGASVISFIQVMYICCMERFLARRGQLDLERGETALY